MGRTKSTRTAPHCDGKNRAGNPCGRYPSKGRTKCRNHGGETPRGVACANYRHGKYSEDLTIHFAADYQAAISDHEIHTLKHEIGIIEARYRELLRRAETSDLGHAWVTLLEHWRAYLDAPQDQKFEAQGPLERTIQRGMQDYLLWQNIQETTKVLSALRYQEHKRLIDLHALMTEQQMEQALSVIELGLYEAVMAHVDAPLGRTILADAQTRVRQALPQRTQG